MRRGYFWPIFGDADEIVFPYAPTREHKHVEAFLGDFRGTLVSDGYEAYGRVRGEARRCAARPVLGTLPTWLRAGARRRTGGGRGGAGADRRAVRAREDDADPEARGRREAGVPA